jgi:hypothetical protein
MCKNCKRIRTYKELRTSINNGEKKLKLSKFMKIRVLLKHIAFTFKENVMFAYNLFRYDDLKQWTKL